MILKIAIVVAILLAGVLIFAAMKPDLFQIERSVSIKASPEKIFALINDFHNWGQWASQDKEDPTMKRTFSGSASGVGAVSEWSSTGSAGTGRMTIVESAPSNTVGVLVDFVKPFETHNMNRFLLEPAGETTKVTWRLQGSNLYVMKLMSVFVDMDKMAGKHFEKGLSNLKQIAEQSQ